MDKAIPSQDILKRFPYDIWSKCILHVIFRTPEGPLPLLCVSSHWQKLLLDSPEMWSYIHIDDGDEVPARVHTFLHLSGRHPLEVAITFNTSAWLPVKPIITVHKERITSIYILPWPLSVPENLPELLGDINFPAVRAISSIIPWISVSVFRPLLDLSPRWQDSTYIALVESTLRSKWINAGLRGIKIVLESIPAESLGQLQRYLRLKHVDHFELSISSIRGSPEDSPAMAQQATFNLSSKRLQSLSLQTSIQPVIEGILKSPLQFLRSLSITTAISHFNIIINAFPSLPSLQFVSLVLALDEINPEGLSRLRQSDISRVREFDISVKSKSDGSLSDIFDALTELDALSGVEVFSFHLILHRDGPVYVVDLLKLLHSLRNCMRIELPTFKLPETTAACDTKLISPIRMPNLRHLRLNFSTPIPHIDAPCLYSLNISPSYMKDSVYGLNYFGRALDSSEMQGESLSKLESQGFNHWNSVQHIKWYSCVSFLGLKTIDFCSIKSVEFLGNIPKVHDLTHAFNNLLVALLRYPDACPQLQTIGSREFPMWGLLEQVIRQRNGNIKIDQLQEILLPGLPAQPLLSTVVALLGGEHNMFMPHNVDDIILSRFKHQVISACRLCISSGYTQCPNGNSPFFSKFPDRWWKKKEDGSIHDRRSDADYLELLEFQDFPPLRAGRVESKLSWKEWDDRLKQMTADCQTMSRSWACRRRPGKLVRIHKYILYE